MEITKELIQKALKPHEVTQFIRLQSILNESKLLNAYQQKKYDEFLEKMEEYSDSQDEERRMLLRTEEVAGFFRVTRQAFEKWTKTHTFPKGAKAGRGLWDFKLVFRWWYDHYYLNAEAASTFATEKLRYQVARTRREELAVEELEGKMIRKEQVIEDVGFLLNNLKQRVLSWTKSLPALVAHKDERECAKVFQDETHSVLNDLSAGIKRMFAGQR